MVTNEQLWLMIGIPVAFNAVLFGLVMVWMSTKFKGLSQRFHMGFDGIDEQFEGINERFDHMRDSWLAELRSFEDRIHSRLTRLEERR